MFNADAAPETSPADEIAMRLSNGIITSRGGLASHAAVVAREYGVPSVVNVAGVTRAVRTGDMLRVDGDRGTVELLPREG